MQIWGDCEVTVTMPQCCRCNGSGRCVNCVCVRNNRTCANCTPGKNGRCENQLPLSSESRPQSENAVAPTQDPLPTTDDDSEAHDDTEMSPQTTTDSQPSPEPYAFPSFLSDSTHDDPILNHVTTDRREAEVNLPPPDFQWGEKDGNTFCNMIASAYSEVVHWRRNVFMIPSGKAGKMFIRELATLYQAYADATSLECVALKACTVQQCLLLQKPHAKSKAKEHAVHLERRLKLWRDGDIEALLREGRCIQKHLVSQGNQAPDPEKTARIFSRLMLLGKVNAALRLLSHDGNGGVLSLDDLISTNVGTDGEAAQQTTRDNLMEKHPKGKPAPDDALLAAGQATNHCHNPIIFEQITE